MNYDTLMEQIIEKNEKNNLVPTLLLHSCCAPCSSAVLERLSNYFKITIYYYNPNITDQIEYEKRVLEQKHFIEKLNTKYGIKFIEGFYDPKEYYSAVHGLEELGEGSKRCYECYKLRLENTAIMAKKLGYDYFTTTLSISPYKNSTWLNEIGIELQNKYSISYLTADFKKKNGYKRSIELSHLYNLYRQDYCGCVYSKIERENYKEKVIK